MLSTLLHRCTLAPSRGQCGLALAAKSKKSKLI